MYLSKVVILHLFSGISHFCDYTEISELLMKHRPRPLAEPTPSQPPSSNTDLAAVLAAIEALDKKVDEVRILFSMM